MLGAQLTYAWIKPQQVYGAQLRKLHRLQIHEYASIAVLSIL